MLPQSVVLHSMWVKCESSCHLTHPLLRDDIFIIFKPPNEYPVVLTSSCLVHHCFPLLFFSLSVGSSEPHAYTNLKLSGLWSQGHLWIGVEGFMPDLLYDCSRKYEAAHWGHVFILSMISNLLYFYAAGGSSFKMSFLTISGNKSINSRKINN